MRLGRAESRALSSASSAWLPPFLIGMDIGRHRPYWGRGDVEFLPHDWGHVLMLHLDARSFEPLAVTIHCCSGMALGAIGLILRSRLQHD